MKKKEPLERLGRCVNVSTLYSTLSIHFALLQRFNEGDLLDVVMGFIYTTNLSSEMIHDLQR